MNKTKYKRNNINLLNYQKKMNKTMNKVKIKNKNRKTPLNKIINRHRIIILNTNSINN
jgi:hypothetical protein